MSKSRINLFYIIGILLSLTAISAYSFEQNTQRRAKVTSWSGQIYNNTVWQDTIVVSADVVVMSGATLTILPGTTVRFEPAKSSKTDAYYFFPQTELVIRGHLIAEGTSTQPIIFTSNLKEKNVGDWAGIILESEKSEEKNNLITYCRLEYVETAIYVLAGEPIIKKNQISFCQYAIVIQGDASPIITQNTIADSVQGIYCLANSLPKIRDNIITGCQEEGIFVGLSSFPIIMDDNRFSNNRYNIRRMNSP